MQKEKWELKNFSVEIKKEIQKMAKEKNMFVKDFVEEILEQYIYNEKLNSEGNKNFFDQRWQEVIDVMELFREAQQKNFEMGKKEIEVLFENLKKCETKLTQLEAKANINRKLFEKFLGIEEE